MTVSLRRVQRGLVDNMQDCNIVVNNFDLKSGYYVHLLKKCKFRYRH